MKLRVHSITRPLAMAVLFWSLWVSAGLLAPTALAQVPLKIGFVNASIILEKAPQAEEARKRLEEEFDERDLALVEAQKFVRELEDRLIDEGSDMSDGDRRKLEREIRNQKRDLKRMEEEFKEDFNLRRNEELGKLQRLVYEAIVSLA
ncbi:MAG: OmpH family outer membrane protein, partial [Candidatus Competibacteraceae bacterium]|nr:OmpH family outer membrane protein [Candidatus Competibacteraceae bacterium]